MSNLIHCDGPACDRTVNPDLERRLRDVPWIRVEPDGPSSGLDFHADACVVAYFSQPQGSTRPEDRPCTCHRARQEPHTKSEHRAYVTVDGL